MGEAPGQPPATRQADYVQLVHPLGPSEVTAEVCSSPAEVTSPSNPAIPTPDGQLPPSSLWDPHVCHTGFRGLLPTPHGLAELRP